MNDGAGTIEMDTAILPRFRALVRT
jgi:hypothetical protein